MFQMRKGVKKLLTPNGDSLFDLFKEILKLEI